MEFQLKTYKTEHGIKTVLVGEPGRKLLPILMMDNGLVLRKVPKTEERYLSEVIEEKKRRSLMPVLNQFASYGKRNGSSKAAKQFIRQCRS